MSSPVLDFDNPPVIETVLGIEFAPLVGWDVIKYGLFWEAVRQEYPKYKVMPPIVRQAPETKGGAPLPIEFLPQLPVRCWFIDEKETRLIQIQHDRFVHNWRKAGLSEAYPRYETIKPIFEREWERFAEFLNAQGLSSPEIRECEITYINHIEQGSGWNSFAELGDVITIWRAPAKARTVLEPERAQVSIRFPMAGNSGYVSFVLQPAIRNIDAKQVLQLTLTARGAPKSPSASDLGAWFDSGRETLGDVFLSLTTERMHRIWQRRA